jgi:hypothetical protein
MKRSPRASWKFWNRVPAPPRRRVHLGIDYGTNTSKMVFRDYGAPGEENVVLVLRNGSCRIPSRVCATATQLVFGDDARVPADCDIYEHLKMQVAAEVNGNPDYSPGLPSGFSAADLGALTVWFLISEGHRAIASYFNGRMEGVEISITMGVPMTFFNDNKLKTSFLSIARRAWSLYCNEGLLASTLVIEKARRVLDEHPAALSATTDHEVRDWIRCEGEAATWWPLDSPAFGTGPYAKVDMGAGVIHANLFRIFGKVQTPKRSLVPYGAAAVPVRMDAVDRVIAECRGLNADSSVVRGLEQCILQENAKLREALMPVREQICDGYRRAWIGACNSIGKNAIELSAWRQHKVFVTGGGCLFPLLVDAVRMHPEYQEPLSVMTSEPPRELVRADHRKITNEELPFVAVAYGLSKWEWFPPNPYRRTPG